MLLGTPAAIAVGHLQLQRAATQNTKLTKVLTDMFQGAEHADRLAQEYFKCVSRTEQQTGSSVGLVQARCRWDVTRRLALEGLQLLQVMGQVAI